METITNVPVSTRDREGQPDEEKCEHINVATVLRRSSLYPDLRYSLRYMHYLGMFYMHSVGGHRKGIVWCTFLIRIFISSFLLCLIGLCAYTMMLDDNFAFHVKIPIFLAQFSNFICVAFDVFNFSKIELLIVKYVSSAHFRRTTYDTKLRRILKYGFFSLFIISIIPYIICCTQGKYTRPVSMPV